MSKYNLNYYDPFEMDNSLFNEFFFPVMSGHDKKMFKCDIKDKKDKYEIILDVPSFKKEEIDISLKNGYLNIKCEHSCDCNNEEQEKEHHKFLRKERYCGIYERQFYVGDNIKEEDISAKLDLGVLKIFINKKENQEENQPKKIDIK